MGRRKRPQTVRDVLDFAENSQNSVNTINAKKLSAWQLRAIGYTIEQTAQILNVSMGTVKNWDGLVKKCFEGMPAVRAAIDRMQTWIPKAMDKVEKSMDQDEDAKLAYQAAKDILTSMAVMTERMIVGDDRKRDDTQLVAEAERIIAKIHEASGGDQSGVDSSMDEGTT